MEPQDGRACSGQRRGVANSLRMSVPCNETPRQNLSLSTLCQAKVEPADVMISVTGGMKRIQNGQHAAQLLQTLSWKTWPLTQGFHAQGAVYYSCSCPLGGWGVANGNKHVCIRKAHVRLTEQPFLCSKSITHLAQMPVADMGSSLLLHPVMQLCNPDAVSSHQEWRTEFPVEARCAV